MNFLEIINKCLSELNSRQVNDFSELTKNEHKRLLLAVNLVNKELCNIENWSFLLKRTTVPLPSNTTEIENPVNGKILHIFIDGGEYLFTENLLPFLEGRHNEIKRYSILGNALLFPKFEEEKTLDIVYYSANCAVDFEQNEKENLEKTDDKSLIPMPFAEQLLVYGACLRVKANPQYFKFSYWLSMYKEALLNLKSKALLTVQGTPTINLSRN